MILTDPPYGTIKNAPKNWTVGNDDAHTWDEGLPPTSIYRIANRVLRKNGKLILFAQQPYTTELIKNAIPNLPHSYNMIWEKNDFANGLLCNKAPVGYYEDILVFSKTHDHEALHPLREYALKIKTFTNYSRQKFYNTLGHGGAQHFIESNHESSQFALCTEKTYNELIAVFGIDKMAGFQRYAELKPIDDKFKEDLPSTFNLWEGRKYKSNILKYAKDYDGLHPTQKPVLLLEDLIKTFSNEGDLVVDLTAGSGTTAIACLNTGRNYILIEKEEKYYNIINKRISEHELQQAII